MAKYSITEEIAEITNSGRLKIRSDADFIKTLTANSVGDETNDVYKKLQDYAYKNLSIKAGDIPSKDKELLINFAITKTLADFDSEKASLLTHFNNKLRGEVKAYRDKKQALARKIQSFANNTGVRDGIIYNPDTKENELIYKADGLEEAVIQEDTYYRKIKAIKMAYYDIPLFLQEIINISILRPDVRKKLTERFNLSSQKILELRNYGLSLVLTKVLRSKHLSEEEKNELKNELHIV